MKRLADPVEGTRGGLEAANYELQLQSLESKISCDETELARQSHFKT